MSYLEKRQIVALLVQEYKIPIDRLAYTPPFYEMCDRYREMSGDSVATPRGILNMAYDARKRKLVGPLVRGRKTR